MSTSEGSPDVIVVGGGIIGCTVAYELQKRGLKTLILEQGQLAREASWASAGILSPPSAAGLPPHRQKLAEHSAKLYETFLPAIGEESGQDTTFLQTGQILVARTEAEVEHLQSQINWQTTHGFETSWLEPDQVRELEPVIPADILGGYYAPTAGAVTLHRFTLAVAAAFRRHGGKIREHTPAVSVLTEGDKVTGVDTPTGPVHAGTVVLAAGAWTRFLGPALETTFPTTPVKGQMIAVMPDARQPRHVVGNTDGGYLVPKIDGTVAIGATRETTGFDTRFTPEGFAHALNLIESLGPALRNGSFVTGWAGLRPGSPDDTPIMGPVPGTEGLWVSTGHYRSGAQLAPGSADIIARAIAGEDTDPILDDFGVGRFAS